MSTAAELDNFRAEKTSPDWQFVTQIRRRLPLMKHIVGQLIISEDQLIFTLKQITECSVSVTGRRI